MEEQWEKSYINSSDESTEDNEPPAKRMIPVCMPHDSARKNDIGHMPEMMDDRDHRSKCRMPKCSSCKIFLCFNGIRICFKRFQETKRIY
ncbi:uncharacterized protein NPIL_515781 [Nephila pilipes]|uniref:Uncharacterized protein n=1 Tax=Nephila pilipes TaxID=299642 RepID=A0A8X6TDC7_NEPPI|nr:uncharacterized protein NPIL_515781 [Nephila pilipes]